MEEQKRVELTQIKVAKRLWQYTMLYKKNLIFAFLLLLVALVAELVGPFIAKQVIDEHILGIEKPWYQVENSQTGYEVEYQGNIYLRSDRVTQEAQPLQEVRVLQVERSYYFVEEPLLFESGQRVVEDGLLTMRLSGETATYPAVPLSASEVFAFFYSEVSFIAKLLLLYFGLLIFASFFQYGKNYLLQAAANQVIQHLRRRIFKHIQTLPVPYFDNQPAGGIVARVTNDTEAIRNLFVTVLASFFTSAVYMLGIYVALFILDPRLAFVCLIILPILVLWIVLYRRVASRLNHRIRALISDINGTINESIQGMRIIQAFSRQKESIKEFEQVNQEHLTYQNKLLNVNSWTSYNLSGTLFKIALLLVIWYFGAAYLGLGLGRAAISIGVIYAFIDLLGRLFSPITEIVTKLSQLEESRVATQRVFHLLDEQGVTVERREKSVIKGDVQFEQVSFAYKQDEYVLKDINFSAKRGETVALVGHTGSGKSSIMNLLFRFYDPQQGSITIDGQSIQEIPVQMLRQHMGIVLQDPFLFSGTIASNVSLDDPHISREQVIKALRDVGAADFVEKLPDQYDQEVVEKGSTLSAGERQLISFARALVFDPAILILDEATSSIDSETESMIQHALDVVKQGRTSFVIAHRLSTIRNADQILVLDHGHIVERGDHQGLLEQQGRYYQMYQLQQGKLDDHAV